MHQTSALQVNTAVDNIGARRLHTVLERIVEDISFDAPDKVIWCSEFTITYPYARKCNVLWSRVPAGVDMIDNALLASWLAV